MEKRKATFPQANGQTSVVSDSAYCPPITRNPDIAFASPAPGNSAFPATPQNPTRSSSVAEPSHTTSLPRALSP